MSATTTLVSEKDNVLAVGPPKEEEEEIAVHVVSLDRPPCVVRGRPSDSIRTFAEKASAARGPPQQPQPPPLPGTKGARAAVRDGPLKLIFQGRLLDWSASAAAAGLRDGCTVHCVATAAPPSPTPPPRDEVHIDMRGSQQLAQQRARGLERLAEMGFSADEIAQFRSLFRAEAAAAGLAVPAGSTEQQPDEIAAEEEWLAQVAATLSPQQQQQLLNDEQLFVDGGGGSGSRAEVIFGFVLGSLLGPIMLLWLVFGGGLSSRAKFGIVLGVSINLLVSTATRVW